MKHDMGFWGGWGCKNKRMWWGWEVRWGEKKSKDTCRNNAHSCADGAEISRIKSFGEKMKHNDVRVEVRRSNLKALYGARCGIFLEKSSQNGASLHLNQTMRLQTVALLNMAFSHGLNSHLCPTTRFTPLNDRSKCCILPMLAALQNVHAPNHPHRTPTPAP